jgi:hypothetical protein
MSMFLQVAVVALAVTLIELAMNYSATAARNRFSILFLLAWTTAAAVLLSVASSWASSRGWTLAEVRNWEYFGQVQLAGLLNAVLAIAIYLSVRWPMSEPLRVAACIAAVVATTIAAPAALTAIFQPNVGASVPEMVWLFAAQGFFLSATLLPAAGEIRVTSQTETSGKPRATDAARAVDSRRESEPAP